MPTILISTQAITENKNGKDGFNQSQAQIVRSMLNKNRDIRILMLQYKNDDINRSSEDDIKVDGDKILAARDLKISEVDPDPKKTDGENIVFKNEVLKEYKEGEEINFNDDLGIDIVLSRSWGQALKAREFNGLMQNTYGLKFVNNLEAVEKSNSRCKTDRCFEKSNIARPLTYNFDNKTEDRDKEGYIKKIKKELTDGGGKVAFYIKEDYGIYGNAVTRVTLIDELEENLNRLNKDNTSFIIQKELGDCVPLRCSIANGRITGIFKGKPNQFMPNPILNKNVDYGPENLEEFKAKHKNFKEFEKAIIAAANSLYDEGEKDKNFLGAVNCLVKVDKNGNIISDELEPITLEVNDSSATSTFGKLLVNIVSQEYSDHVAQEAINNSIGNKPLKAMSPTSYKEVGPLVVSGPAQK